MGKRAAGTGRRRSARDACCPDLFDGLDAEATQAKRLDDLRAYLDGVAENGRLNRKRIETLATRPAKKGAPGRTRNLLPGGLARVWTEETR